MLAGHYAPAFIAHRLVPRAPLWALLLAAQAVDVGFMLLGLFGIEGARLAGHEPRLVVTAGVWTHSLPATAIWAVTCGLLAARLLGSRSAGVAIGAVVASHWFADLLVHTPDLPLGLTQEPAVGLGLWLHPPWAWALECGLVLASCGWLALRLPATARRRALGLGAALVGLQTLSEFVIPTPPVFGQLAASALAIYAATALGGWSVDRARGAEPTASPREQKQP